MFAATSRHAVIFAVTTGSRFYECSTQRLSKVILFGSPTFAFFHRVSSQIVWLLMTIDSKSKQHGLESTMDLWMTDVTMPPLLP